MLVLKSWRGPFSAGRILHVRGPSPIIEPWYFFQTSDKDKELLILGGPGSPDSTRAWETEIGNPGASGVWLAAEAQPLMEALDEAVRRDQALRIDLALKKCLTDAATQPKPESLNARCRAQAHLDELLLSDTEFHPDVIAARAKLEELDQVVKGTQKQAARQHEESR